MLAKVAVTFGLLAYLWFKIDPAAALTQFQRSDPLVLLAGTLVLGLLPVLGALRWRVVLSGLGAAPRFAAIARWTYISVFFSQVLPATIGADALRMWLAHRAGFAITVAVNSVALDRAAMFLSLVVLLAAVSPQLGGLADISELRYLAPLLLAGTVAGLAALMLGDRLPARLQRLRAVRALGYLAHDARRVFLSAKFAAATVGLSCVSYFTIIVSVYLFALAFGANLGLRELVVLLPPVLVASSLPISIGGWGTREMAMVVALGTVGTSPHTAVLVSLWLGVASILISLPGAVLYLTDRAPLKPPLDAAGLRAGS